MTCPARRIRRSASCGAALLSILALAAAGCLNPFLPAHPEPPAAAGSSESVDIDFTSTEGLLSTMSQAVANKNQGNAFRAYMSAFADSSSQGLGLRLDLDPDVVQERSVGATKPIPPPNQARQTEATFYNYIVILNAGDYDLSFEPNADADVHDAPDHAIIHRTYILSATDNSTAVITQIATGKAEIEMRLLPPPSSNWVITRWTDTNLFGASPADPGQYCFSRLMIDAYNYNPQH